MLSRQFVREHPDAVREGLALRGASFDLDVLLEIDQRWREHKSRGDDLRQERNEISDRIGELKRTGDEEAAQAAIERSKALKAELETTEAEADKLETKLETRLLELPNVPQDGVPPGEDEQDNKEVRRVGVADATLPAEVVPHYELGEQLGILDFERGAKVAGGGFYFLRGDGARLEHALIQFMRDCHRDHGYTELFPPIPVSSRSMTGTGQLPKFADDAYRVGGHDESGGESYDEDDLWLCPTAEVPVTNMYRDEILLNEDLPIKHQAYTPNFRREAGEHGTETRGLGRLHQFNKVELVNFVAPDHSNERLEGLVGEAETVLEALGLPYRVVLLCGGDLTFSAARTYDIEVWAPADDMDHGPDRGGRWLEVSSASNFEAFQARRAGLRYRPEQHESAEYLHTLNASGTALPRLMIALLEHYQNQDGTVTVPAALRPYMNGQELIEGHEPVGQAAVGAGQGE